jgi:hypothetical protein
MESTAKGDGRERSSHLHGTAKRGVLSERKMGAGAIVIVGVGSEDPAQMGGTTFGNTAKVDRAGGLLIADDLANIVWRVSSNNAPSASNN